MRLTFPGTVHRMHRRRGLRGYQRSRLRPFLVSGLLDRDDVRTGDLGYRRSPRSGIAHGHYYIANGRHHEIWLRLLEALEASADDQDA